MNEIENYKHFCEKCNYKTDLLSSYKKHLESTLHITGKRKIRKDRKVDVYKCDKCNYESVNELNFKTHNLNNHLSKEERKLQFKFYCDKCDFGCFTETCYTSHIQTQKHKIKTN